MSFPSMFPPLLTRYLGNNLSIPMPCHPVPPGTEAAAKKDVETLERLVDEHNVVFLLMDSRESQWLPTVLGATNGKVCSFIFFVSFDLELIVGDAE